VSVQGTDALNSTLTCAEALKRLAMSVATAPARATQATAERPTLPAALPTPLRLATKFGALWRTTRSMRAALSTMRG
jgi:hypothetical protein